MARNRIIKPEFWADAKIGRLSFGARLLFVAMWNFADDYGTISASPRKLLGEAFENDESVNIENVREWLAEIEAQGQIIKYTACEKEWYEIPHFLDHQKISHKSTRVNPLPPWRVAGESPESRRQDTGSNGNGNDNGNGNGCDTLTPQQTPPDLQAEKPLALHDQAYIPQFAQIAAALNEPDLIPTTNRLKNLRTAMQNVTIAGGFKDILAAATNLARSPAPDSIKRFDWLLNKFDYAERITEYLTAKNGPPKPRKYSPVPDDWDPHYDDITAP